MKNRINEQEIMQQPNLDQYPPYLSCDCAQILIREANNLDMCTQGGPLKKRYGKENWKVLKVLWKDLLKRREKHNCDGCFAILTRLPLSPSSVTYLSREVENPISDEAQSALKMTIKIPKNKTQNEVENEERIEKSESEEADFGTGIERPANVKRRRNYAAPDDVINGIKIIRGIKVEKKGITVRIIPEGSNKEVNIDHYDIWFAPNAAEMLSAWFEEKKSQNNTNALRNFLHGRARSFYDAVMTEMIRIELEDES